MSKQLVRISKHLSRFNTSDQHLYLHDCDGRLLDSTYIRQGTGKRLRPETCPVCNADLTQYDQQVDSGLIGMDLFRAQAEGTFKLETFLYDHDNYREAKAFLGERGFAKCKTCGGSGEYEGEYGPKGCQPCNSRCIAVQTRRGVKYADYGDRIIKNIDGTFDIAFAEHSESISAR